MRRVALYMSCCAEGAGMRGTHTLWWVRDDDGTGMPQHQRHEDNTVTRWSRYGDSHWGAHVHASEGGVGARLAVHRVRAEAVASVTVARGAGAGVARLGAGAP